MATPNDIYNEITRIDNAKQGIAEAIEEKGVQVPENSKIEEYPGLVRQIQQGSPDAVLFTPQDLTPEQQGQARTNIGATAPEIFWAVYGETTVAELDTAIAANKLIALVYQGRVYPYTSKTSQGAYTFDLVESERIYRIVLSANGNWSNAYFNVELTYNKSQSIETYRASETKYPSVKAVFDSLGKWGVVSQTQNWTGNNNTGYDYTMSNQVWGLIPQANIDLYVNAGAVFNETTGYFELNGLTDISYNEMTEIYKHYSPINISALYEQYASLRTVLPNNGRFFQSNFNSMFGDCLSLEVTPRDKYAYYANGGTYNMFVRCSKLKKIGNSVYRSSNLNGTFTGCSSLESVSIQGLSANLSFADCPRLTLVSVVYAVNNAANTAAITITLHATAYARCQADTTEYTYEGNTYTGIIAYAAAKNITIASA